MKLFFCFFSLLIAFSCSLNSNSANTKGQEWCLVGVYNLYELEPDPNIVNNLSSLTITTHIDTLTINGSKTKFESRRGGTENFLCGNDKETLREFYINYLSGQGVSIQDSVSYLFLSGYPNVDKEFKFSEYAEWGYAFICEDDFLFLHYDQYIVIFKRDAEGKDGCSPKVDRNDSIRTTCFKRILKVSKYSIPYDIKTDPNSIKYETIKSGISGMGKYLCGEPTLRYIPMPDKDDISIILVPMDCGDFSYRYYMLTIKDNTIIGELYVEGECWEPESSEVENTNFSINDKYEIKLNVTQAQSDQKKTYGIDNNGGFYQID